MLKNRELLKNSIKLILLTAISYLACCNNANVNQPVSQDYTYAPIHVGDMRQFKNEYDSSTFLYTIVGKTLRRDGKEVFVQVQTIKYSDTSYLYIQYGFCIYTQIDTPFTEQKLYMEKPIINYSWNSNFDILCRYSYINNFKTFAGEFRETYLLERLISDGQQWLPYLRNYYGKNIGLIGGEWVDSIGIAEDRFLLTYAKIDGKEYGQLLPAKNRVLSKTIQLNKLHFKWDVDGKEKLNLYGFKDGFVSKNRILSK